MTEEALAAIEKQHGSRPDSCYWHHTAQPGLPIPHSHQAICQHCTTDDHDEPWPCDAARLVAEVRRLRAELELIADPDTCIAYRYPPCWQIAQHVLDGQAPT